MRNGILTKVGKITMGLQVILGMMMVSCAIQDPEPYGTKVTDTSTLVDTEPTDEPTAEPGQPSSEPSQPASEPAQPSSEPSTENTNPDPSGIEIYGNYYHQGNQHTFNNSAYSIYYGAGEYETYQYVTFSNPQRWFVAQNGTDTGSIAGLYSRFDWNIDSAGVVLLCHTKSNAQTSSEAQYAPAANALNPYTGCNGGEWMAFSR